MSEEGRRRVRMAVCAVVLARFLLVLAEGVLRLSGFRHEAAPMVLRFGYPDPPEITGIFRTDPRLFWRLRPGSVFDTEACLEHDGRWLALHKRKDPAWDPER